VTASSIDWSAVRAAASVRLAMPRTPLRGLAGERLGAGTGSSLEFEDYRPYTPGDDLRHVDWAAYARSEMLAVRLYREEVAPRLDLVIDVSRSMAVTDQKLRGHGALSGLLACACTSAIGDTRVITRSTAAAHRLQRPEDLDRIFACTDTLSALEEPHLPFRRRSVRVVISDFLFPHEADVLVARLARECAWLALIQLTLPEEVEPAPEGGRRLVDVEGHGELDVVIDHALVRDYRERFARLRLDLSRAARRVGAPFAHLSAAASVREMARELAAAGIVEAA
jgi:uncharacterized protein (DUF58 family)